ncbi:hypothetical protein Ae717Ps2_6580c [Pseudonocardia sp. Ae717_Ps2]|uniref:hypothetical protein n=1 Tax=Pseudonocardia sp. Ae717_Ps2 TaxID=1885573 RepID=UPI000967EB03|nr:hypothetical protein [Pseudonocardia sp. Ae717_Ps2]OLM28378.1 hypothetical protein Ae717Ps2_6580c [Pseudonocardia sp. Ae717_Ps2]
MKVAIRNADFDTPLGVTELGHISTSITDWTIRYSRMWNDGPAAYDQAFRAIQAARGRKGSGRNGGLAGNSRPGGLAGNSRPGGLVREGTARRVSVSPGGDGEGGLLTARIAKRRTKTGRELAEQFGVTRATVVRMMAEPREEFLARARDRRATVVRLKLQGSPAPRSPYRPASSWDGLPTPLRRPPQRRMD